MIFRPREPVAQRAGRALGHLLDLLLPPSCPACRVRCERTDFCPDCEKQIIPIHSPRCVTCGQPFGSGHDHQCIRCLRRRPHFTTARATALYRSDPADPLAIAIARYKYGFDVTLAPPLGRFLQRNCPLELAHDMVVPVPLHSDRLRWRGFNQAALLARDLASKHKIAFAPCALKRQRGTPPQVGLGEEDRRRNIKGAFVVPRPRMVSGRTLLLVDDVYTTGATVNECARTLRRAGAKRVDVLVLARAA